MENAVIVIVLFGDYSGGSTDGAAWELRGCRRSGQGGEGRGTGRAPGAQQAAQEHGAADRNAFLWRTRLEMKERVTARKRTSFCTNL